MDAVSYAHSAKQAKRIKRFIENPDSNSGVLTQPKVIEVGETVTIKSGRQAILADTVVDGDLVIEAGGDVFVPAGAGFGDLESQIDTKVAKVTGTDNAIVRFDGTTGEVQDSSVIIDDNGSILIRNSTGAGVQYMTRYDVNNFALIRNHNVVNTIPIFETAVAGVIRAAILSNGTYQSATNVYGSTSDIKLKENVVDATPKLDKLMNVKVKNFNYIGQEDKQIGVIAQEIEEVFPSVVFETKDTKQVEVTKERIIPAVDEIIDAEGNIIQEAKPEAIEEYTETETQETGEVTKNVKYSIIYMMMLKGMQEQQEIINDLKERIEILEGAK